jgi:hypothetical protein
MEAAMPLTAAIMGVEESSDCPNRTTEPEPETASQPGVDVMAEEILW